MFLFIFMLFLMLLLMLMLLLILMFPLILMTILILMLFLILMRILLSMLLLILMLLQISMLLQIMMLLLVSILLLIMMLILLIHAVVSGQIYCKLPPLLSYFRLIPFWIFIFTSLPNWYSTLIFSDLFFLTHSNTSVTSVHVTPEPKSYPKSFWLLPLSTLFCRIIWFLYHSSFLPVFYLHLYDFSCI